MQAHDALTDSGPSQRILHPILIARYSFHKNSRHLSISHIKLIIERANLQSDYYPPSEDLELISMNIRQRDRYLRHFQSMSESQQGDEIMRRTLELYDPADIEIERYEKFCHIIDCGAEYKVKYQPLTMLRLARYLNHDGMLMDWTRWILSDIYMSNNPAPFKTYRLPRLYALMIQAITGRKPTADDAKYYGRLLPYTHGIDLRRALTYVAA